MIIGKIAFMAVFSHLPQQVLTALCTSVTDRQTDRIAIAYPAIAYVLRDSP